MSEQIVDLLEAVMPGPMGDVTPEAVDALDRAEQAAERAEAFAGQAEGLQDEAVAALVSGGGESTTAVDGRVLAAAGRAHVLSMVKDLDGEEASALPDGTIVYVTEDDSLRMRSSSSARFRLIPVGGFAWSAYNGDNGDVRGTVEYGIGQVQVSGRGTSLKSNEAVNLFPDNPVTAGSRPYLTASIPLTCDTNSSNLELALEVRADTGEVVIRNRGGANATNVRVYGTLVWRAEA